MAQENPTWGAPRLHGELLLLGFDVADRNIPRYLTRPPGPNAGESRKAFLRLHQSALVAMGLLQRPDSELGGATAGSRHLVRIGGRELKELWVVEGEVEAYRRQLSATLAVAPRMRMGFVLWFSKDEDILRYFAVKANAFAREPDVPQPCSRDPYLATWPTSWRTDAPAMPLSRMIATEGVSARCFIAGPPTGGWPTPTGTTPSTSNSE